MRSSHFIPFFMGALFAAVACSSDDPEDDINPSGTGGTVTATGGAAATGGSNQVGSGGVVTGTGGTSTGSGGAVEGTGGSEVIIDTDTFYLSTTDAGVPFGIGVYDYNDEAGSTFTTTVETPGTICTTGTAAQVTDINGDGSDDYDLVYGGGIGINMNTEELITADLTGCTGFSFTIDSVPSGFRVGVAMDTPEGVTYFTTATAGENIVNFADIMAGEWVTDPPPLDIARIKDMQFQVSTNTNAAVPFTFCLSNLQMLGECTPPTPMDGTGGAGMGTGGEGMGTGGEGMGTGGEGSGGDPGTGGEMGSGGDPGTGGEMGSGGDPGAGGSPE